MNAWVKLAWVGTAVCTAVTFYNVGRTSELARVTQMAELTVKVQKQNEGLLTQCKFAQNGWEGCLAQHKERMEMIETIKATYEALSERAKKFETLQAFCAKHLRLPIAGSGSMTVTDYNDAAELNMGVRPYVAK